jgi:glucokinase
MTALAIDLGGTKLSLAVFSREGEITGKQVIPINNRTGNEAGGLIVDEIKKFIDYQNNIDCIGIAVPGIYHQSTGRVWAPNIGGWDDYPLLEQVSGKTKIPIKIDSDRACSILGEVWKGNASRCAHAIYLAVGTGIGAGILIDGKILRGVDDIGGAIGWMALKTPFEEKYVPMGCFEYYASGDGIVRTAREYLRLEKNYEGILKSKQESLTSHDLFDAYDQQDHLAKKTFETCIGFWAMAIANLVSLFNPEKIILGGGVFGPAVKFIPAIKVEAEKWAQPISIKKVSIESSALGTDAVLYGAAFLALQEK